MPLPNGRISVRFFSETSPAGKIRSPLRDPPLTSPTSVLNLHRSPSAKKSPRGISRTRRVLFCASTGLSKKPTARSRLPLSLLSYSAAILMTSGFGGIFGVTFKRRQDVRSHSSLPFSVVRTSLPRNFPLDPPQARAVVQSPGP